MHTYIHISTSILHYFSSVLCFLPVQVVLQYTLEIILGFLIPYTVIVVSYICILRRIRQTKFRRRIRSEKLILAIVLTFCLFWLPYHFINLVQVCPTVLILCIISSSKNAYKIHHYDDSQRKNNLTIFTFCSGYMGSVSRESSKNYVSII